MYPFVFESFKLAAETGKQTNKTSSDFALLFVENFHRWRSATATDRFQWMTHANELVSHYVLRERERDKLTSATPCGPRHRS